MINNDPHIHQMIICANVFVRDGERYLLLKRSAKKKRAPGYIHPIGGKVDSDEDPLQAAQRELLEEADITVSNIALKAVITEIRPIQGEDENRLIFRFPGDYNGEQVIDCEEGEFLWLTKREIVQQKLFPSLDPIIEQILDSTIGTIFTTYKYAGHECNATQIYYQECVIKS